MKVTALGFTSAADAPCGSLIAYSNGTIILVSEYGNNKNANRDCYIVGSGEYFCGDFDEKGILIEVDTKYPVEDE